MMDYRELYEFSFFSPGTSVEATSEIMMKLLETFKDKGFLPTTVQEIRIGQASGQRLQLQLNDKNMSWFLAFEPHRVLLRKQNARNIDMGTPDDFVREAAEIFERLLLIIPLVGTRLSYVTKGFLAEMPPDILKRVNGKILNLPPFYQDHTPHQWVTRTVARNEYTIGEKEELLNIITDINRAQGKFYTVDPPVSFDRVQIGFDINTYQKNATPRFRVEDIGMFLSKALEVSMQISTETERLIYG